MGEFVLGGSDFYFVRDPLTTYLSLPMLYTLLVTWTMLLIGYVHSLDNYDLCCG